MTEEELLNTIAKNNHTTPEEVRKEMQTMIDDLWNGENDTEEFKKLRLLIRHKPPIMEFVNYAAGMAEQEKKPGIFHRKRKG